MSKKLDIFLTNTDGPEVAYLRDGTNDVLTDDAVCAYADADRYTLDNMVQRFAQGIAAALDALPYRPGE